MVAAVNAEFVRTGMPGGVATLDKTGKSNPQERTRLPADGTKASAPLDERGALQARSDAGERLTAVEQGTLARLTGAAKVKTSADFTIKNGTPKDIAELDAALKYLGKSKTAAALIAKLPKGAIIEFNSAGIDAYFPKTKTIFWDPGAGVAVTSGEGSMSPALVLSHEIDHAVGWTTPKPTLDRYDNSEEKRVILGSERKIAKELGEVTRDDHDGELVCVKSSTTSSRTGGGAPDLSDFLGAKSSSPK